MTSGLFHARQNESVQKESDFTNRPKLSDLNLSDIILKIIDHDHFTGSQK